MNLSENAAALRARLKELAATSGKLDFAQPQQEAFKACLEIADEAIKCLEATETDRAALASELADIDDMLQ